MWVLKNLNISFIIHHLPVSVLIFSHHRSFTYGFLTINIPNRGMQNKKLWHFPQCFRDSPLSAFHLPDFGLRKFILFLTLICRLLLFTFHFSNEPLTYWQVLFCLLIYDLMWIYVLSLLLYFNTFPFSVSTCKLTFFLVLVGW